VAEADSKIRGHLLRNKKLQSYITIIGGISSRPKPRVRNSTRARARALHSSTETLRRDEARVAFARARRRSEFSDYARYIFIHAPEWTGDRPEGSVVAVAHSGQLQITTVVKNHRDLRRVRSCVLRAAADCKYKSKTARRRRREREGGGGGEGSGLTYKIAAVGRSRART